MSKRLWLITDKGDQCARRLADEHYTRQTPGDPQFCRNGQNLVFLTGDCAAVWVTFRPTPGKATRMDGLDAWECSLFRNTSPRMLSSELVTEATLLTLALWGWPPKDGLITSVDADLTRPKKDPGYCYLKAGWVPFGHDASGRPRFKMMSPYVIPDHREWRWRGIRGGKLRVALEAV